MTRVLRRTTIAVTIALAMVTMTGCVNLSNLAFRQDHRLHFLSPAHRELTKVPVTLRWTMDDFRVAAPGSERPSRQAGYFGVFVDRAPVKPGQTLASVADGDPYCQASTGCPGRGYLAKRQVYFTTHHTLTLRTVLPLAGNNDDVQLHDVTVVLLDTSGHRIGESAWYQEFKLRRPGVSP